MNKTAFNFYVNKCFRRAKRLASKYHKEYAVVSWRGGVWVMSMEHIERTQQQSLVIKRVWE